MLLNLSKLDNLRTSLTTKSLFKALFPAVVMYYNSSNCILIIDNCNALKIRNKENKNFGFNFAVFADK